jgi:AraC family transcriptional regulator
MGNYMAEKMKKLLGDGPYPFPIEDINGGDIVEAHLGQGMIVLESKHGIDMLKGVHAHDSYEFLMPITDMPYVFIDNKVIYVEKDKLLPINAQQFHGPAKDMLGYKLWAFQIDTDILNQISMSVCKKPDITFVNESVDISKEIGIMLRMFMEESRNMQAGRDFILQNLINLISVSLLRQLKSDAPKMIAERNYCENENISRAISFLREQYNKDYSLDDVARLANLSPFHFIRIFKSMTDKTPYDYLLDIKIEKAKELLRQKRYTITDICFLCGFNNLEHFSSVFKRKAGILPSQYRKL